MLGVEPLELQFGYNKEQILSCSVELSNDTDGSIAFMIEKTSPLPYSIEPDKDIVKPRSKCSVDITLPVVSIEDHKAALQYRTSNGKNWHCRAALICRASTHGKDVFAVRPYKRRTAKAKRTAHNN